MTVSAGITSGIAKIQSMSQRVQGEFHWHQPLAAKFGTQLPEFKMRAEGVQALRVSLQRKVEGLLLQSYAWQKFLTSFSEQFTLKLSPSAMGAGVQGGWSTRLELCRIMMGRR